MEPVAALPGRSRGGNRKSIPNDLSLGWLYAGNLRPCYEPVRSYEPVRKRVTSGSADAADLDRIRGTGSSEKVGRQSRNHRAH